MDKGVIERSGILYKHINDVVEIFFDRFHKYDNDVLEFFNTIAYLGGRSTVNLIRGPLCCEKGQHGVAANLFEREINLGGPSEPTRAKKQTEYSTSSGVIKRLSLSQLNLSTYQGGVSTFFIYNGLVGVVLSVLSNDGNALKPAIEFDLYKNQNIGLNVKIDYEFVSKNPEPSLEYLKDQFVTEAVATSVTTLGNTVRLPCNRVCAEKRKVR